MKFSFLNRKPKNPVNPDPKAEIKKQPLTPEGIDRIWKIF